MPFLLAGQALCERHSGKASGERSAKNARRVRKSYTLLRRRIEVFSDEILSHLLRVGLYQILPRAQLALVKQEKAGIDEVLPCLYRIALSQEMQTGESKVGLRVRGLRRSCRGCTHP